MSWKVGRKAIGWLMIAVWGAMAAPVALADTVQYIYDGLNRLEEVRYPDGTIIRYGYDAAGNRLVRQSANADLSPTAVSGPASALSLETVTIATTVRNQGLGGSGAFRAGIYLSADNAITAGDRYLGEAVVSDLAAGSETVLNVAVQVPSDVTPGAYYWGVIADHPGDVLEFDEGNNARAGNAVDVAYRADLVPQAISGPALAMPGQPVPVTGTVRNAGAGESPSFLIGIYLSTDNTITAGDNLVGQVSMGVLSPGAQQPFSATITIPAGLADGTYYWGAIADDSGVVLESDETNNVLGGNAVGLVADGVRIPGSPASPYQSLQAAYDAAADGATIQCIGAHIAESLVANRAIGVVVEGGYAQDFQAQAGSTILHGTLTVTAGTVTIRKFELAP